jgi:hypothetical protein
MVDSCLYGTAGRAPELLHTIAQLFYALISNQSILTNLLVGISYVTTEMKIAGDDLCIS